MQKSGDLKKIRKIKFLKLLDLIRFYLWDSVLLNQNKINPYLGCPNSNILKFFKNTFKF